MGTPDFSVPVLNELVKEEAYEVGLVVTQPDRPVGRKRTLTPPPVKKAALEHGIDVFQPENIQEDYEPIVQYNPDLIVTAAYGQLLPKELLELPPFKCINVHASLLPKLRGGAPIHYSIIQGYEETGITVMYMVEKLDAGDILTQEKVLITDEDNVGTLHDKLAETGSKLLLETLPKLFKNEINPEAQVESESTYAPNISRDVEKVDWSKDARDVFNLIRGLCPWPVAYSLYEGQRMKLWDVKLNAAHFTGSPGEVVAVNDDHFTVLCGDGRAVNIFEVQPAGKKRMSVEDYLRGSADRIVKGTIMGE